MEPARARRSHRGPARPLTVAELVALHGGPPGDAARVDGPPVPVGALLRREGRAPHAVDRPTVPRRHPRPQQETPAPPVHSGRRATVATGAVLMVGAVLGTAVVNESVVAQPHTTPDTGSGGSAAGPAAAAGNLARAAHTSERPLAVSYSVSYLTTSTSAVPVGFDLPVASGASIGRGARGGAPVGGPSGSASGPGGGQPPAAAIPRPRTPVDDLPPPAATTPIATPPIATPPIGRGPVVVVPSMPLPPVLGPLHTPAVAVSAATITAPTLSLSAPKGARIGPALPVVSVSPTTITTPDLQVGAAEVPLPDVALPAVDLPSAPLPVAAPVTAVGGVVGGLLGR